MQLQGHESKVVTQVGNLGGAKILENNSILRSFKAKIRFKRHVFSSRANIHKINIKTTEGHKLLSHPFLLCTTDLRPRKKVTFGALVTD